MQETPRPRISPKAFVSPSATILGDVHIGDDVYVAPHASIRADEPGSRIIIQERCNVQDNVVIHAVQGSTVEVGRNTTLAHGCIVHGPCIIGEGCFVGFGTVVFTCTMMDGSVALHRAVVVDAFVPPSRLVRSGEVLDGRRSGADLPEVPPEVSAFVRSVVETNVGLANMYAAKEA